VAGTLGAALVRIRAISHKIFNQYSTFTTLKKWSTVLVTALGSWEKTVPGGHIYERFILRIRGIFWVFIEIYFDFLLPFQQFSSQNK
jgi:hypothetical protein